MVLVMAAELFLCSFAPIFPDIVLVSAMLL